MILTCPECTTRFKIADDAIGANGRTVRCSQCSTTWFVAAEPDALSLDEAEEITEIREEVIREKVSDAELEQEFSVDSTNDSDGTEADDPIAAGLEGVGAHAAIRDNAERKKVRKRLLGVGLIWLIPLIILTLFGLAAYFFRAIIVDKYPGTAPIYKSLGLVANSSGLEIYELKRKFITNEGIQALVVNGKIKNFDVKPRDVNMIRFDFKNANGDIIGSWVVDPGQSVLKPGAVLSFASQYPNPPIDAEKLGWEFVTETEAQKNVPMASQ